MDELTDQQQTQRIGELTERLARLELALQESPITAAAVRDVVMPLAVPPDVADGDVITAAHINAIKMSVNSWQADVAANQFALNDLKTLSMVTGVSGDGLQIRQTAGGGLMFMGFQNIRNSPRIGSYSGGWRPTEIVGADGEAVYAMNSNQDGYVFAGFQSATGRGALGCYNPAAGGWKPLVINEGGSVMMYLGGTLKTLTVDGSGFVKAV